MMMTCRLLCALLVLALCCCPSVHAGNTQEATEDQGDAEDPNSLPVSPKSKAAASNGDAAGLAAAAPGGIPGNSQPVSSSLGSTEQQEKGAVEGGPTVTVPQGNAESVKVQRDDKDSKTGTTRSTSTPTEKIVKEAEDTAKTTTTTTTTKSPTTTTTTTAPEAPSTTTTEAPTTTTTRAPSRLRRIDGSLSSSAWVCAPLLLAASALAYTALD
ncbi:putative mucin TcMUCII [Trypanosoma cruzi]|uniref:Mucin TcMUCII, putative n=3 Tax=Trypanosoma cruzi TaxID=5693 RepID=Q4DR57_TRYCC|nr:mucin TcMUCII, putative [Trypanosoma cruzi]EAN95008.1 mucin TcMUCII, putative [Trypanosoma cruzi]PWV20998.1 putative mucin TcMUCII [Trypanosoma cruzi]|eukprot:XP_816859.1 mucin TcMUCII [Trypanosoma cruzi strain CL Brener]